VAAYLLLNFVFLSVAPMDAMAGKVEIGYIAAQAVMGETGASVMGTLLALLLISTVSAMIVAAPRVLQAIGKDFPAFRELGVRNRHGIPTRAILLQSSISLVFLWTASFESILIFSGATMALNTFFTVLGLFILRRTQPNLPRPYKTWLYPLPPLVFLGLTGWTLVYTVMQRPVEGWMTVGVIVSGACFYWLSKWIGRIRHGL
jgi:APA family basic amino acid/polyamine antiporter